MRLYKIWNSQENSSTCRDLTEKYYIILISVSILTLSTLLKFKFKPLSRIAILACEMPASRVFGQIADYTQWNCMASVQSPVIAAVRRVTQKTCRPKFFFEHVENLPATFFSLFIPQCSAAVIAVCCDMSKLYTLYRRSICSCDRPSGMLRYTATYCSTLRFPAKQCKNYCDELRHYA